MDRKTPADDTAGADKIAIPANKTGISCSFRTLCLLSVVNTFNPVPARSALRMGIKITQGKFAERTP